MRKITLFTFFICLLHSGYGQDMYFEVKGLYSKSIKHNAAQDVHTMKDINPGYPSSWISDTNYISTRVTVTTAGTAHVAMGNKETFSPGQVRLISKADLNSDIEVQVHYYEKNAATENMENRTMNFSVTVVPDKEAEFSGGYDGLKTYLYENAIKKISNPLAPQFDLAKVKFTISEDGSVRNVHVSDSTESAFIDKLLRETVTNMPKWQPAKLESGESIPQDYELILGSALGC